QRDILGNIFVVGFTNIQNGVNINTVSGLLDAQLSAPFDPSSLTNYGFAGQTLLTNGVGVNVYGVPWIIGAKKGFPAFNKFGMQTIVQATRKLQIYRSSIPTDVHLTKFTTNQLITFSIKNLLNADCWNSYTNAYTNSVYIQANDVISMEISNNVPGAPQNFFYNYLVTSNTFINPWPGYNPNSAALSFTNPLSTAVTLLSDADFYFGTSPPGVTGFYSDSYGYGWESNNFNLTFPRFTLLVTNRLQLYMLDASTPASGYHVIDYVELGGPVRSIDLTAAIETNNPAGVGYGANMWSQATDSSGLFFGIKSQITVSEVPITSFNGSGYWLGGAGSPNNQANVEGFSVFMGLNPGPYPGSASPNNPAYGAYLSYATNYVAQVPYTPTVTVLDYTSWQVNDPLVHYLASDLTFNGVENNSIQTGLQVQYNAIGATLRYPSFNLVNDRYQPWSLQYTQNLPVVGPSAIVPSAFGLAVKDPLLWISDDWNFPTNLLSDLTGLGQVHRGTPWQTVYLKADDVLNILDSNGDLNSGTNTWVEWTGDDDIADAATMAPVNDWHLASLVIALLNTNNITQLMSVNDPNATNWLNVLNGLTVYSNTTLLPPFTLPRGIPIPATTFDAFTMGGNSTQAEMIANGIAQAKAAQPNHDFYSVGDILSAPELTVDSPWLNTTNNNQLEYGITDAAYETIPAQLLLLLRPDSIGALYPNNGGVNLQFSGSDALSYLVQQSPDLVHWTAISTNHPLQGVFNVTIPSIPASSQQFYRSVVFP
ncbi:MAG TPA: hypothetical protein VNX46_02155, partial [Candidatus Acidoferrum sp.]|nr:hypothetical protein [Candidatus Acidoferrum sp.]